LKNKPSSRLHPRPDFINEALAGALLRNNLSNNEQMSIRHSDAHLLMQVYKRNALVAIISAREPSFKLKAVT